MKSLTRKDKLSFACNLIVAALTALGFCIMLFGWAGKGMFQSTGLTGLRFFTVLSNLFSGIVSLAYAIALVATVGRGKGFPRALAVLKLAATTSVALTFFTVVVLFEGIFGLRGMFKGANLLFHLVLPVLSMVELCVLDAHAATRMRATFAATIPMLLYGIAYYGNILVNGLGGEWPNTNDWYGFASWGLEWVPLVFAIMFLSTWLIACLLRFGNAHIAARGMGNPQVGHQR